MTKAQVLKEVSRIAERLNELQQTMQDYADERSDSWHESDAGTEYIDLIDSIGEAASMLEGLE